MTESQSLLAEYARNGSDAAFRELVTRYVDLVYSTALRLVKSDTHRAEDVAQTVFVDLARKARTLPEDVKLGGWLHRDTCLVAGHTMRSERRRQSRERQAVEMYALQNHSEADFSRVAPILDEAINELGEEDRTAILLRFFEQHDFRSVGQALGSNEDAARMRVTRALEKLANLLKRRGVTASSGALTVVLGANAVQAAPVGLAVTISTAALLAGTTIATTISTMNWINLKSVTAVLAAALTAGTGAYLVQQREANQLRGKTQDLMAQQEKLVSERDVALSAATGLKDELEQFRKDKMELLRLRGEVGVLRQRKRELEQAATKEEPTPSVASPPASSPAPFRLHLVVDNADENTEPMTRDYTTSDGRAVQEKLRVQRAPLMDHTAISSASVSSYSLSGAPQIEIRLTDQGREQLAKITRENVGKRIAFTLDGKLYSAPVIQGENPSGRFQIVGAFTEEQARELAAKINAALVSR